MQANMMRTENIELKETCKRRSVNNLPWINLVVVVCVTFEVFLLGGCGAALLCIVVADTIDDAVDDHGLVARKL